jgi:hypothetical protein
MKQELFKNAPEATVPMMPDGGFINKEPFVEWLMNFAKHAEPKQHDPVILTADNHFHIAVSEAATLCRRHYITLLSPHLHSSHKLQPLDRGFLGSPKRVYASGTGKWMHYYPGFGTSQSHIYLIFRNAYENINKIKLAKKLFQVTGLEPFNTGFFSDVDFCPSEVISRPQGNL